jgi:hypothetical protein
VGQLWVPSVPAVARRPAQPSGSSPCRIDTTTVPAVSRIRDGWHLRAFTTYTHSLIYPCSENTSSDAGASRAGDRAPDPAVAHTIIAIETYRRITPVVTLAAVKMMPEISRGQTKLAVPEKHFRTFGPLERGQEFPP